MGYTGIFGFYRVAALWAAISGHVRVRDADEDWTDEEVIVSLILLNLLGGKCGDD